MDKILALLEQDAKLTPKELAVMCGDRTEEEIRQQVRAYEEDQTILGYQTLIDWEKTDREYITALIELKVVPQPDRGFDEIAGRICKFPEVQSAWLMSGGFDLCVLVSGKTMREVALFVAEKLSIMENITATATHFVLRKYKDNGVVYGEKAEDERNLGEV